MALVERAAILHVAGALVMPGIDGEPTADLLRRARAAGVITFLDTVWDDTGRWMKVLGPCLPYVDVFVPSLAEAWALTGETDPEAAARSLLAHGVKTVALKMDIHGCLVATRSGDVVRVPAYQVTSVDSTGAGDAFAAGFIAGTYLGWNLEATARLANACGALCVTGAGAAGGTRSLSETLAFMADAPLRTPG
jgi:sugar/nucleoside kinase (ribokinase family)